MVDINSIWESLVKGLNIQYANYTYMTANQEGNLPAYPYCIINCITPYKRDKDMIRGTITRDNIPNDDTKVQINKTETPQMIFSFNCSSDNLDECLQVLKDTIDYLTFSGKQFLEDSGIIILECSPITDRTNWLETKYQYKWGFDLTIRVTDTISMQVDSIGSVEVINEN